MNIQKFDAQVDFTNPSLLNDQSNGVGTSADDLSTGVSTPDPSSLVQQPLTSDTYSPSYISAVASGIYDSSGYLTSSDQASFKPTGSGPFELDSANGLQSTTINNAVQSATNALIPYAQSGITKLDPNGVLAWIGGELAGAGYTVGNPYGLSNGVAINVTDSRLNYDGSHRGGGAIISASPNAVDIRITGDQGQTTSYSFELSVKYNLNGTGGGTVWYRQGGWPQGSSIPAWLPGPPDPPTQTRGQGGQVSDGADSSSGAQVADGSGGPDGSTVANSTLDGSTPAPPTPDSNIDSNGSSIADAFIPGINPNSENLARGGYFS